MMPVAKGAEFESWEEKFGEIIKVNLAGIY